jgi:RNA polymerase sigma-70 factor (ECF subfamily)
VAPCGLGSDAGARANAIRKVFGSCLAFLRDAAQAEDVTQGTFLQAYRHLDDFSGGNALGWLLTIARNRCIDRHRSKHQEVFFEDSSIEFEVAPSNRRVGTSVHLTLRRDAASGQSVTSNDFCEIFYLATFL